MKSKSNRTHSPQKVADALGVHLRTVYRWLEAGAPHDQDKSGVRMDVEETRDWQARSGLSGARGRPRHDRAERDGGCAACREKDADIARLRAALEAVRDRVTYELDGEWVLATDDAGTLAPRIRAEIDKALRGEA